MESDKRFFTAHWLYEQVLITWVERRSLVPPCPAGSSLVTIVLPLFSGWQVCFQLASHFVSRELYLWCCQDNRWASLPVLNEMLLCRLNLWWNRFVSAVYKICSTQCQEMHLLLALSLCSTETTLILYFWALLCWFTKRYCLRRIIYFYALWWWY